MSSPYRENALVAKPPSKFKYRVVYDDPTKDLYTFQNPTRHRFYWTAWLAAWWYCQFNGYASATIQVRRS